jgi:uncharacterized membrane protein YcaP (DUF421 family)
METVIRGLSIYLVMLLAVRFSGRRTLGQMTAFDFVLLLIVAETTQQALLGEDFSITNAFMLIATLFSADVGLSYVKRRAPRLSVWLDGQPTVLISRGVLDRRALERARVGVDEVLAAAREQNGLERLDQIRFAVLEASGNISIIPEPDEGSG